MAATYQNYLRQFLSNSDREPSEIELTLADEIEEIMGSQMLRPIVPDPHFWCLFLMVARRVSEGPISPRDCERLFDIREKATGDRKVDWSQVEKDAPLSVEWRGSWGERKSSERWVNAKFLCQFGPNNIKVVLDDDPDNKKWRYVELGGDSVKLLKDSNGHRSNDQ